MPPRASGAASGRRYPGWLHQAPRQCHPRLQTARDDTKPCRTRHAGLVPANPRSRTARRRGSTAIWRQGMTPAGSATVAGGDVIQHQPADPVARQSFAEIETQDVVLPTGTPPIQRKEQLRMLPLPKRNHAQCEFPSGCSSPLLRTKTHDSRRRRPAAGRGTLTVIRRRRQRRTPTLPQALAPRRRGGAVMPRCPLPQPGDRPAPEAPELGMTEIEVARPASACVGCTEGLGLVHASKSARPARPARRTAQIVARSTEKVEDDEAGLLTMCD